MKTVGIVLLVLGTCCLLYLIFTLVLETSPRASDEIAIGFLGNTWAPILASFFIPGGIALLMLDKKRKKQMVNH